LPSHEFEARDQTAREQRHPPAGQAIPLVFHLAPWSLVLLAALQLKRRIAEAAGGGYDYLAEVLNLGDRGLLTSWQRLSLFGSDLLVVGVIGGLLLLGLLRVLPQRLRPAAGGAISLAIFLVTYAQLKSHWEVATFISGRQMAEGLFGPGRELMSQYATSATVLKLGLSVLAIVAMSVWLQFGTRFVPRWMLGRRFRRGTDVVVVTGALASMVVAFRQPADSPFARSAGLAAMEAFLGSDEFDRAPAQVAGASATELIAEYARIANAPLPNAPSPYFGAARGYDVVVWLFESLPFECASLPAADSALQNFRSLERNAFVARSHYATYPYSRRAYSSIYSSWYPLNGIRGSFERLAQVSRSLTAPGMVRSAAEHGYETAAFVPERPVPMAEDSLRYAALGFAHHVVPPSAWTREANADLPETDRAWVRTRDREGFAQMVERTRSAIADDRRYLFAFNPQLTHGPWPGLSSSSTTESTCAAGLPLYQEVDSMFGEYLGVLRESGRLDRTLIVALGDHGLRTRTEYPPFHGGSLDDITFHVPLLLYAPGVLSSPDSIPWMTSHIDIAPSVLDLLGISRDRELEVGSPMWDPRVAERTTYFFAKGYLGADGLQRGNEAVMVRYLFGGVSRAPWRGTLRFSAGDLRITADPADERVIDELNTVAAIQSEITRTMLPDGELVVPAPVTVDTGRVSSTSRRRRR
jgi:hypothetical protein